MNTPRELPHAVTDLSRREQHRLRATQSPREATLAEAVRMITDLMRCVLWLLRHGIYVIGFAGWRGQGIDRIVVTVAASPYLYILLGSDNCAWRERRQDGVLTIYTWFADRFGCRIEWEEVTCA